MPKSIAHGAGNILLFNNLHYLDYDTLAMMDFQSLPVETQMLLFDNTGAFQQTWHGDVWRAYNPSSPRFSPFLRRQRYELERHERMRASMDLAVRNLRVVARRWRAARRRMR